MREIDLYKEVENIKKFIVNTLNKTTFQKVILGLSGGIDSALSSALCASALGSENVIGVMMPYKSSSPKSIEHAKLVAQTFKITYDIIPITSMVDAYFDEFEPDANLLRRGNRMARERMCILYDLSAKYKAIVVGTSNKSEIYTGYCTQYGDSACAFEPFAHLYKTEVWQMAKILKIPDVIIDKKPTADLWEGQTDEEDIGISYYTIDEILHFILDEKIGKEEIIKRGFTDHDIELVLKKIEYSEFKRRMPLEIN